MLKRLKWSERQLMYRQMSCVMGISMQSTSTSLRSVLTHFVLVFIRHKALYLTTPNTDRKPIRHFFIKHTKGFLVSLFYISLGRILLREI